MTHTSNKNYPIKVYKVLNTRPKFFILPADLLIPLGLISTFNFVFFYIILGLEPVLLFAIEAWLGGGWWILAGEKSYKFTDKLYPHSGKRYYNLNTLFVAATDLGTFKRKMKTKIKPVRVKNKQGKKDKLAPFQMESDLHSIMEVEFGEDEFSLLLKCDTRGNWSATIPFALNGIHTQLYDGEIEDYSSALSDALKDIPYGETATFKIGCRSKTRHRISQLDRLSQNNRIPLIELLLESDRQRIEKITEKGFRQEWDQYIFVSWTQTKQKMRKNNDFLSSLLNSFSTIFSAKSENFAGIKAEKQREIYIQLAKEIYENSYIPWKTTLSTKAKLACRPLSSKEIWEDLLWYRFNKQKAPEIPQLIKVRRSGQNIESQIKVYNTKNPKDTISVLLQGEKGRSSCPQHYERRDVVAVNEELVAAMVLEEPVELWDSKRKQWDWLWSKISDASVLDTEVYFQISNANKKEIETSLTKITKQSSADNEYAIRRGEGLNVGSTFKQREAIEARSRLHQGADTHYGAMTILIYRKDLENLSRACNRLSDAFSPAKLVREENVCWKLWNETLPFNNQQQLRSTHVFSERRFIFDSFSIRGFLPLRKPQLLHDSGLELIHREGGFPIHLNLFKESERAIITGKSGSGKSVISFGIIQEALARNAKVVGIDMSNAGESTFQLITELLGNRGAYFNIAECSYNLLQPPDLRNYAPQERERRMKIWENSLRTALISLAMGKIDDPELYERVDSILLKLLNIFFNDEIIIERYNNAFDYGWQSSYWQDIPVLEDLLFFCSREKLGLYEYSDIDERAIAQISNQIGAKLVDPNIGKAISRPSDIPPLPDMTFFALSGLTNETNSYIMALVAQMACLNVALENPKSLFVMDECSVLLNKRGFADIVGERFATGRKEGQSVLLVGQDLESIAKCSARDKILVNTDYHLIGKTTSSSINTYEALLKTPYEVILPNTAQSFVSNRQYLFSNWLLCQDDRFWSCQYFPSLIALAALANSQDERAARAKILERYPRTTLGIMKGLSLYSKQMRASYRRKEEFKSLSIAS